MPTLSGTVRDITGAYVARVVRAYARGTGVLQAEGVSAAGTGAFSLTVPSMVKHTVVALDATYSAEAASTLMLMNLDGENLGTIFTEEKGKVVTSVNAVTKTDYSKYGGSSAYFNGNSSVSIAYAGMSTFFSGAWTLEAWVLTPPGGTISNNVIFGSRPSTLGMAFSVSATAGVLTGISVALYDPTVSSFASSTISNANASGVFNHVAICKSGLVYTFFVNGVQCGSTTRSAQPANSSTNFWLGCASTGYYPYYFTGYLDDFRMSSSVLYTGTFTPPSRLELLTSYGSNALIYDDVVPV